MMRGEEEDGTNSAVNSGPRYSLSASIKVSTEQIKWIFWIPCITNKIAISLVYNNHQMLLKMRRCNLELNLRMINSFSFIQ